MSGWSFADVWEVVAEQLPDAPAKIQGDRRVTWREFDRRANGIAQHLIDAGVQEQDKVAQYLYNCPEYMESVYAAFKAGLAPINTNYRYLDDELLYLWDNGDVVCVVFHGTFVDRIEGIRDRLPRVTTWLWVDDGSGPCPEWATPYEDAAAKGGSDPVQASWGRDGDHLLLLYTGGTTGMPKGVMWRQDDLFRNLVGTFVPGVRDVEQPDLELIRAATAGIEGGPKNIPACPLMHGTGLFTQLITLSGGGGTVCLESRNLDIDELLSTVGKEGVATMAIVGDAFAKPMLRALDANPGKYELGSLFMISSSGVMFSEESKQGLLRHHPGMMIVDAFSSSEAVGMGQSVSTGGAASATAKFTVGEHTKVITDDGREVLPGSGETGRVAVGGYQPIGYYKDPEKSAATFIMFEGKRYSVPGDYAMVESDGSLTLLGRGSVCINTGGEKVYPEEVEEVLKTFEHVADAVAVGVPDEKFGEAITAVVELASGTELDERAIIEHVKGKLAAYKAPKRVLSIDTIGRAENGKVDYKRLKAWAADQVGSSESR
jgi:acyl-CoA synthetase (AMP-forming)/AMP-acid ligase II